MCELMKMLADICIRNEFPAMQVDYYSPEHGSGVENVVWTKKGGLDQPSICIRVNFYADEKIMSFTLHGINEEGNEVRIMRKLDQKAIQWVALTLDSFQIDLI